MYRAVLSESLLTHLVKSGRRHDEGVISLSDALSDIDKLALALFSEFRSELVSLLLSREADHHFITQRVLKLVDFNADLKRERSDPYYKAVVGMKDSDGRVVVGPTSDDWNIAGTDSNSTVKCQERDWTGISDIEIPSTRLFSRQPPKAAHEPHKLVTDSGFEPVPRLIVDVAAAVLSEKTWVHFNSLQTLKEVTFVMKLLSRAVAMKGTESTTVECSLGVSNLRLLFHCQEAERTATSILSPSAFRGFFFDSIGLEESLAMIDPDADCQYLSRLVAQASVVVSTRIVIDTDLDNMGPTEEALRDIQFLIETVPQPGTIDSRINRAVSKLTTVPSSQLLAACFAHTGRGGWAAVAGWMLQRCVLARSLSWISVAAELRTLFDIQEVREASDPWIRLRQIDTDGFGPEGLCL